MDVNLREKRNTSKRSGKLSSRSSISLPVFVSQSLYIFESNTRSAIIIGAMGSGGIGMLFLSYMRTGVDFENVAYVSILVLITVMIMDMFSAFLRRMIIGTNK